MWEQFTTWLNDFSNNPVVISLITIFTLLGAVLAVFSKTSVGRKTLNWLKEKVTEIHNEVAGNTALIRKYKDDTDSTILEFTNKADQFLNNLNTKVATIYSKFEFLESGLIDILKDVPNAKVQAKLDSYIESKEKFELEVKEALGDTYSFIQKKINAEVENRVIEIQEKANNEIAGLKGEIDELKQIIAQITNVAETAQESEKTEDGEREEEENTNTEKENA